MNAELTKQALVKVGNPNFLVNIVSRRVRQLTTGGGSNSRPLIADTTGMGAGDIALTEIIEDKLGWEIVEQRENEEQTPRTRKKKKKS